MNLVMPSWNSYAMAKSQGSKKNDTMAVKKDSPMDSIHPIERSTAFPRSFQAYGNPYPMCA
jgi:hypothetical protein